MVRHLDYVEKWIKDIEYQLKVCNGKFLAGYALNAGSGLINAYRDKEIDQNTEKELREKINELIDSFDKICTCQHK